MTRKRNKFKSRLGLADNGDPRLTFLVEAGHGWLQHGDPQRAFAIFQGLALLAPNDPAGPFGMAAALLETGRLNEALIACDRAIHCINVSRRVMAMAYNLKWQTLRRLQRIGEAWSALQNACRLDPEGIGREMVAQLSAGKTLGSNSHEYERGDEVSPPANSTSERTEP